MPLGGRVEPIAHRMGSSLPAKTHGAFKRPPDTARSEAGYSSQLKETQESKKALPASLGGTQMVLRAVGNAARHGVWVRVQASGTGLEESPTADMS